MKFKSFYGDEERDIEVEASDGTFFVTVEDQRYEVDSAKLDADSYSLIVEGKSYEVSVREEERGQFSVLHAGDKQTLMLIDPLAAAAGAHLGKDGPAELAVQMPGRVVKVLVAEGDEVVEGQGIIVLEAMKMENEVSAPRDGVVSGLFVAEGDTLEAKAKIAVIS